ncbi:methyl-accepting chemotaxis protein [Azohydromonas lata]|uniref:Methyl-accepting chemotaxis protein n=1 Tax=Azohydromonas lata TaxID=45677 RepID=A0ABU5I742_9BURK|nr:methyl-accepting chemotaxis protein [Azohydromonas lata]MDZ5454952.1 methyl-accepting chemotaxis protein [Azohydromonas lata]
MNMLRNLSIGTRLALSFAGVLLLIAFLVVTGWTALSSAQANVGELIGLQAERLRLAAEWHENVLVSSRRALVIVASSDKTLFSRFEQEMKQTAARTPQIQKRFAEIETTSEGSVLQEKLAQARMPYLAQRDQLLAAGRDGNPAAQESDITQFKTVTATYIAAITALFEYEQARSEAMGKEVAMALESTRMNLMATGLGCALLAVVLGWTLARSIVQPLSVVQRCAERIADGDLGAAVPQGGRDEVGRLLAAVAAMQEALRRLVGQIGGCVQSIGHASSEVAAGNQELSQRTEQAAANLQQTASAVEQIAGTMRHSAAAAEQANRLARTACETVGQGGQTMLRVVGTMEMLSQSSQRIGDIVGVIDGIAFQTNILALNAAVEAARAGEHGRGFAVVASEVRALAQRSATAARQIKTLIDESVERVAVGAHEAQVAGQTVEGVVASVSRVSEIVAEITQAAVQQSKGIFEISSAVAHLDHATQQNAALVEESAAAAASLHEQAGTLSRAVQQFRL